MTKRVNLLPLSQIPRRKTAILVSSVVAVMGLVACSSPSQDAAQSAPTITSQADSLIDPTDPQQVAGFASDVFFAEVIEVRGSTERRGLLETQFLVRVTEVLKGSASGEVTVNQEGGLKEGVVYLREGDELLSTGNSYLIAARYNSQENWYTVVPVGGDIPVSETAIQGRAASGRPVEDIGEVRATMLKAIANPIPFGEGGEIHPVPTSTAVPPNTVTSEPTTSVESPITESIVPPTTTTEPPTTSSEESPGSGSPMTTTTRAPR